MFNIGKRAAVMKHLKAEDEGGDSEDNSKVVEEEGGDDGEECEKRDEEGLGRTKCK